MVLLLIHFYLFIEIMRTGTNKNFPSFAHYHMIAAKDLSPSQCLLLKGPLIFNALQFKDYFITFNKYRLVGAR